MPLTGIMALKCKTLYFGLFKARYLNCLSIIRIRKIEKIILLVKKRVACYFLVSKEADSKESEHVKMHQMHQM